MQKLPQRSVSQVQTSVYTAAVSAMTNLMRKFASRRSLRLSAWKPWVSHVLWGHTCISHIGFAVTCDPVLWGHGMKSIFSGQNGVTRRDAALPHVLSHCVGSVRRWAVSKHQEDLCQKNVTPCLVCCSGCWSVLAAHTEMCSHPGSGQGTRPHLESLGATGGPEALEQSMWLLPELRWFPSTWRIGSLPHTSVSQWVCLFCPIPRLS